MTTPDIQALSSDQLERIHGGVSKVAFTEDAICGTPWKRWPFPWPVPGVDPNRRVTIPVLRF